MKPARGNSVHPRSRKSRMLGMLPSRLVVTRLPANGRRLFLTFDDGPDPEHTPQVLDILRRHGATASFFLVGELVDHHPGVVRRIVAEGHRIGNHSWSHPLMTTLPLARQIEHGAPADLFIPASEAWMDYLDERKLIERATRSSATVS